MKLIIIYEGRKLELVYDDEGKLQYVNNLTTGTKEMIESYVEGNGYEIKEETFLVHMKVCDARYARIMAYDLFIPRYIFIPNL